jgi:hypothetical protein
MQRRKRLNLKYCQPRGNLGVIPWALLQRILSLIPGQICAIRTSCQRQNFENLKNTSLSHGLEPTLSYMCPLPTIVLMLTLPLKVAASVPMGAPTSEMNSERPNAVFINAN